MHTLELAPDFKIHALQTGTVQVRQPHYSYKGPEFLKQVRIMASTKWTAPLPVWIWLIESPQGNFLVDTGENTYYNDDDYFGSDKASKLLYRHILKIAIREEDQLVAQLDRLGMDATDIDAVVLTHLHIDHTDGLKFVQNREILVSKTEWTRQWGTVPGTWPRNFSPATITYGKHDSPFEAAYPLTPHISIVPTPGHTHGHQSVLVTYGPNHILLAGDTTFNQEQMIGREMAGISIDFKTARKTLEKIAAYARQHPLVYLPSHDPWAGQRLENTALLRL